MRDNFENEMMGYQSATGDDLAELVKRSPHFGQCRKASRAHLVVIVVMAMMVVPTLGTMFRSSGSVSPILLVFLCIFAVIGVKRVRSGFLNQPEECTVGEVKDRRKIRYRDGDGHTRTRSEYLVWDGLSDEWCRGSQSEIGGKVIRYRMGKEWHCVPYDER